MLKKHVTPNARSAENMHFGGYFIKQNFHKLVAIQKSLDFLWPPYFSWKNSVTPSFFMAPLFGRKWKPRKGSGHSYNKRLILLPMSGACPCGVLAFVPGPLPHPPPPPNQQCWFDCADLAHLVLETKLDTVLQQIPPLELVAGKICQ